MIRWPIQPLDVKIMFMKRNSEETLGQSKYTKRTCGTFDTLSTDFITSYDQLLNSKQIVYTLNTNIICISSQQKNVNTISILF